MKLLNKTLDPMLPGLIQFQPAGLLALPNTVEASDSMSVIGSGVGGGAISIKAGIGEYFERRHFYREIVSGGRGRLGESLSRKEVSSFANAFVQTASNRPSVKEIYHYEFALTEVFRSRDFSSCLIPSVCISLSSHALGNDGLFYPLRDTCGCSFHWNLEDSYLGAVKEFLERQFLVRFWLTSACRSRISPVHAKKLLQKKSCRQLYNFLKASGEVTVLDISDDEFPGACLLVVYGQRDARRHVQYCAGMSYAPDLASALEKSLLELWQTFRFMDLFKATESDVSGLEDYYIRYFLSCNNYKIYKEVVNVRVGRDGRVAGDKLDFTLSGILSVLKRKDISGYFYSRRDKIGSARCVYSKYVSPDFFLHMNNSSSFNLKNKYSKSFESEIMPSRVGRMVPFP